MNVTFLKNKNKNKNIWIWMLWKCESMKRLCALRLRAVPVGSTVTASKRSSTIRTYNVKGQVGLCTFISSSILFRRNLRLGERESPQFPFKTKLLLFIPKIVTKKL